MLRYSLDKIILAYSLEKAQEKYMILCAVTQGGDAFIVVLPVQLMVAAFVVSLPRREEYYEKI